MEVCTSLCHLNCLDPVGFRWWRGSNLLPHPHAVGVPEHGLVRPVASPDLNPAKIAMMPALPITGKNLAILAPRGINSSHRL